jgi:hypothetical protein
MATSFALTPAEARLQRKRQTEVGKAKAMIHLAADMAGPFMAVVLLNEALRSQLDLLKDQEPGRPG